MTVIVVMVVTVIVACDYDVNDFRCNGKCNCAYKDFLKLQ